MKLVFVEDVELALRKGLRRRLAKRQRFKRGERCNAEFLGEDLDAETIDFQLENGLVALKVPRSVVEITK